MKMRKGGVVFRLRLSWLPLYLPQRICASPAIRLYLLFIDSRTDYILPPFSLFKFAQLLVNSTSTSNPPSSSLPSLPSTSPQPSFPPPSTRVQPPTAKWLVALPSLLGYGYLPRSGCSWVAAGWKGGTLEEAKKRGRGGDHARWGTYDPGRRTMPNVEDGLVSGWSWAEDGDSGTELADLGGDGEE